MGSGREVGHLRASSIHYVSCCAAQLASQVDTRPDGPAQPWQHVLSQQRLPNAQVFGNAALVFSCSGGVGQAQAQESVSRSPVDSENHVEAGVYTALAGSVSMREKCQRTAPQSGPSNRVDMMTSAGPPAPNCAMLDFTARKDANATRSLFSMRSHTEPFRRFYLSLKDNPAPLPLQRRPLVRSPSLLAQPGTREESPQAPAPPPTSPLLLMCCAGR